MPDFRINIIKYICGSTSSKPNYLVGSILHPVVPTKRYVYNSWSLSYVTDDFSENISTAMERGAVKKLMELLTSSYYAVQLPALRTVGNLLTNLKQSQLLISYGILTELKALLNCPQKAMKRQALWAISNITAGTKEIQSVIDINLFPKLMEIISSQDDVIGLKREAYWACSNALSVGSSNQIQYLIDLGVIIPFCDALTSNDQKTVLVEPSHTRHV